MTQALRSLAFALCVLAACLPAIGSAQTTESRPQAIAYRPSVVGDLEGKLAAQIRSTSKLFTKERELVSIIALVRRAEQDMELLERLLRSEGYYDGTLRYQIEPETEPVEIALQVEPGPRYALASYDILYLPAEGDSQPQGAPRNANHLGLEIGEPARARQVLEVQANLVAELHNSGYPQAELQDRRVVVDHTTRAMEVTLTIELGPYIELGHLRFVGLDRVREDFVRQQVSGYQTNKPYSLKRLNALRSELESTGLFTEIVVTADEPDFGSGSGTKKDVRPVVIEVKERKHRSVGFGLRYATSEGISSNLYHENRNVFGGGQKLRNEADISGTEQTFATLVERPHFFHPKQSLVGSFKAKSAALDAFDEESLVVTAALNRPFSNNLTASLGIEVDISRTQDSFGTQDARLVSVPLALKFDNTNDLLDPSRGYKAALRIAPHIGEAGTGILFARIELDGSAYVSLLSDKSLTLAARTRFGVLTYSETNELPADERFFAGGAGSVRGYAFQEVGPLDLEGVPTGGRSALEAGLELRWRFLEKWGVVPFLDAGGVFDEQYPDFQENIQVGAGLGVRYYTSLGPVRLDLAMPVNRRSRIDDPFQVYLSLGQAF